MAAQIVAVCIFVIMFGLVITEKIEKQGLVIAGYMLLSGEFGVGVKSWVVKTRGYAGCRLAEVVDNKTPIIMLEHSVME